MSVPLLPSRFSLLLRTLCGSLHFILLAGPLTEAASPGHEVSERCVGPGASSRAESQSQQLQSSNALEWTDISTSGVISAVIVHCSRHHPPSNSAPDWRAPDSLSFYIGFDSEHGDDNNSGREADGAAGMAFAAPTCVTGFNAIVVFPIGPIIVGGIVPPPEGLPTLTINPDGTAEEPPETTIPPSTESDPTSSSSSVSSSEPVASCNAPTLKAKDLASSAPPSPTTPDPPPPATGQSFSTAEEPLPVLEIVNTQPINPNAPGPTATAALNCGSEAGPYSPGSFYQYGKSFSRLDGLNAIAQFCDDQVKKKTVVGDPAARAEEKPKVKPTTVVTGVYDTPGGSGKIRVRLQTDVDNRQEGQDCPGKVVYNFDASKISPLPTMLDHLMKLTQ
ncbi:MAG: hypothetical protein M1817_004531 [Caeruleum heppii]|nr:MAG: hypothetical protein M1817_004531 [Caeruleum heppii]